MGVMLMSFVDILFPPLSIEPDTMRALSCTARRGRVTKLVDERRGLSALIDLMREFSQL